MEQTITWSALGIMTAIMLAGFTMLAGRIEAVGAESAQRDAALGARIEAVGAESAQRDSALGARIDALDANLTARIDGSNARIDQVLFAMNPRRANG